MRVSGSSDAGGAPPPGGGPFRVTQTTGGATGRATWGPVAVQPPVGWFLAPSLGVGLGRPPRTSMSPAAYGRVGERDTAEAKGAGGWTGRAGGLGLGRGTGKRAQRVSPGP